MYYVHIFVCLQDILHNARGNAERLRSSAQHALQQYFKACIDYKAKKDKYNNIKLTTNFSTSPSSDGGDECEIAKKVVVVNK